MAKHFICSGMTFLCWSHECNFTPSFVCAYLLYVCTHVQQNQFGPQAATASLVLFSFFFPLNSMFYSFAVLLLLFLMEVMLWQARSIEERWGL